MAVRSEVRSQDLHYHILYLFKWVPVVVGKLGFWVDRPAGPCMGWCMGGAWVHGGMMCWGVHKLQEESHPIDLLSIQMDKYETLHINLLPAIPRNVLFACLSLHLVFKNMGIQNIKHNRYTAD